jgi:Flp pilus assembly protein TadD
MERAADRKDLPGVVALLKATRLIIDVDDLQALARTAELSGKWSEAVAALRTLPLARMPEIQARAEKILAAEAKSRSDRAAELAHLTAAAMIKPTDWETLRALAACAKGGQDRTAMTQMLDRFLLLSREPEREAAYRLLPACHALPIPSSSQAVVVP